MGMHTKAAVVPSYSPEKPAVFASATRDRAYSNEAPSEFVIVLSVSKAAFSVRTEKAAFETDKTITNSEGASFEYARSRVALANTAGFSGEYEGTTAALVCIPIAKSNSSMQRDYWMSAGRHRWQLEAPEEIGKKAAGRAIRRLGARKIPTCQVPIVFDPLSARSLLNHIFEAVSGSAIYRRSSFLVDQIGETVASSHVTIVDDARMPEIGRASCRERV